MEIWRELRPRLQKSPSGKQICNLGQEFRLRFRRSLAGHPDVQTERRGAGVKKSTRSVMSQLMRRMTYQHPSLHVRGVRITTDERHSPDRALLSDHQDRIFYDVIARTIMYLIRSTTRR